MAEAGETPLTDVQHNGKSRTDRTKPQPEAPPGRATVGAMADCMPVRFAPAVIPGRLRQASGRRPDMQGLHPENNEPVSYIGKTPAKLLLNIGPDAGPPVRP